MKCDLCGDRTARFVARIEGTSMSVCSECKNHGVVLSDFSQSSRKTVRTESTPELIETVRDETPVILRQFREKKEYSMDEFSKILSIKSSTYQHYESGHTKPDIETAKKLEKAVGQKLVVHIKLGKVDLHQEDSPGLTLGHFIKKR